MSAAIARQSSVSVCIASVPGPNEANPNNFAVLVGLYEEPERPANAVDYVRKFMGETVGDDATQLRAENDQLREENARLKGEAERLRMEVDRLRGAAEGGGM